MNGTYIWYNIIDLMSLFSFHTVQPIDFDDFMLEKEGAYSGYQAYKNSKAGNVLFTTSLSSRLEGTGIIVNSMCPGVYWHYLC